MADSQYPVNGILRRVNPTAANFVVTKFEVSQGYRDRDEIENEVGLMSNILGVDQWLSGDVEVVCAPNASIPVDLTTIVFNTALAYPNYANFANANVLTMLVNSDVKPSGTAGKGNRYTFKVIKTAVLPTAGPG